MGMPSGIDPSLIARHNASVDNILKLQITDPAHRRCGGYPDDFGLYSSGAGSGTLDLFAAAFVCPQSRYYRSPLLVERMKLAVRYLNSVTTPDGNINNPVTNFNSPPDTAFTVVGVAHAMKLVQMNGHPEIAAVIEPWLRKAGAALARGGVHTPNHRWVMCEAMSLVDELLPAPEYGKRIDQWLAEGVDIDADGQFNERSTIVYNSISDIALTVVALKRNKPELLDLVRRNLNAMQYLLHSNGEVVTELSIRQDQYERGDMYRYWFPLRLLAIRDGNGQYATLARRYEARSASLSYYLLYPELLAPLPADKPLPDDYVRLMPEAQALRVRRGSLSATALLNGGNRFFTFRNGKAVIEAVRFASAFFGKGQFKDYEWAKEGDGIRLSQKLQGPYYQPVNHKVRYDEWGASRAGRAQSEICRLEQSVLVREKKRGFALTIQASGTPDVPLAVEIALRGGGDLQGCTAAPKVSEGWLLKDGFATYSSGGDKIRFGPGLGEHAYTQVRGADPKIAGPSVYICGFTPFRHVLEIEAAS